MSALDLDSPVQYVKGVGPRRAELFANLGIRTVRDLLLYFPFRHETDQGEIEIAELEPDTLATVRGEVTRVSGKPPALVATISDGTGECRLRWFQVLAGRHNLFRGATVVATGRVQVYGEHIELVQPRIQVYGRDADLTPAGRGAQRVGVYRGTGGLPSTAIRRAVQGVLAHSDLPLEDVVPPALVKRRDFPALAAAVRAMHRPESERALEHARQRLAYDEFLLMETALALRRRHYDVRPARVLHLTPEMDRRIRARFPFAFTAAQNSVIAQVAKDLGAGRPMTRLVQGDVGSGKTVVALHACLVAVANGCQAAIMAPTEILAQQHYLNIQRYLEGSRVRTALLRGGTGAAADPARAAVAAGEVDLVVGTHALLQKSVEFPRLALVVVDEQHKFGVVQRHALRTKGPLPHFLVMTATPIPRTLAMTVFGDLDVSVLKQGPPGRGRIRTRLVTPVKWAAVMDYVRGRLERGEQAYVVCPQIGRAASAAEAGADPPGDERGDGTDGIEAQRRVHASVRRTYDELTGGPWRDLPVAMLHGGLRSAEKDRILADFAAGRTRAVVSTTVVEVGVDVAAATVMIIEHAERFGLSQLHQLRGRVGRGERDGLCVLVQRGGGANAAARMQTLVDTTDGFRVAEADLALRGPGELFGTRQHGLPELRVGNLVTDIDILGLARDDAFELVRSDPRLERPEHRGLRDALRRAFAGKLRLIDAA